MGNYYKNILRPVLNNFLNDMPCRKTAGQFFRIARDLASPFKCICQEVVVEITTYCSLRCAHCNNLMPCYERPYHIPSSVVLSDIEAMLEHMDTCVKLALLGGEPFLHPGLGTIIDGIRDNPRIMYIEIVTNATVMPDEKLLDSLAALKCKRVAISDYGVSSQKVSELKALLEERGIPCRDDKAGSWVDPGDTVRRGKDQEQLKKEYSNCYSSRYCKTLLNGKIYLCARSASLADLGLMDASHDSFDIRVRRSAAQFRREFNRFMCSDYAEACDYCDHAKKIKVPAGEQLTARRPLNLNG